MEKQSEKISIEGQQLQKIKTDDRTRDSSKESSNKKHKINKNHAEEEEEENI